MRLFFTIVLVCYLGLSNATAQRYFDSAAFYYYISEDTLDLLTTDHLPVNSRVFPVWSTRNIHQDSSHTFEFFKYINFELPAVPPNNCWPQTAAGKLGHRIIETPQSITLFNKQNEPIHVRLDITDTAWTAFDNDSLVVKMLRLPDETKSIFDSSYTVHRFSLNVYFKDSIQNIKNIFHQNIIEIAEGLGVVTSPMLDNFPYKKTFGNLKLLGLINTYKRLHFGQTVIPKPNKLFETGDQFDIYTEQGGRGPKVYYSGYFDETWTRQHIIAKTVKTDSVYYTFTTESVNHKKYSEWYNPSANYDSLYTYPSSQQQLTLAMGFPSHNEIIEANRRTLNEDDFRGAYINQAAFPYNKHLDVVGDFYCNNTMHYDDSLWCTGFSDHSLRYKKFFGIGIPEHESYYVSGGDFYKKSKLLYAKKNSKTWGTPYPKNVGLSEVTSALPNITVYPNPVNTILSVSLCQTGGHIAAVTLYDMMGKSIIEQATSYNSIQLDVSKVPNGLYRIQVNTETNQTFTQKIIICH